MPENAHLIFKNLMNAADRNEGGFGKGAKISANIFYTIPASLLSFYKNEEALQQACLSLDKMLYGGIYDHIGRRLCALCN